MRVLALVLPFLQLSLAATYTVSHRFLTPGSESAFEEYGTITLPTDEASAARTIRIDRKDGGSSVHGSTDHGARYQVLLTGENLGEGLLTSTKACYLTAGLPSLTLHQPVQAHGRGPSGIDIVPPSTIPADGACPPVKAVQLFNPLLEAEISIKQPHLVFGPDLAPPVPVNPTGAGGPAQPVEEKSFLQKYWLPLLGVGFFVISQMAPEDKPAQTGAAGAKR